MDEPEIAPSATIFGSHDPMTLVQLRDVASRAEGTEPWPGATIEVVQTLRPIVVVMAPDRNHDLFRD